MKRRVTTLTKCFVAIALCAAFSIGRTSNVKAGDALMCSTGLAYQHMPFTGNYYSFISGDASCPTCGPVNVETNWDDGTGWEDAVEAGPHFDHEFGPHQYPSPGTYHPCISADDATGAGCSVCTTVEITE